MTGWTEKDLSDHMAKFQPTLKDGRARSIRTAPLKSASEVGASVPAGLQRQRQADRSGRDSSERRASKYRNIKTTVDGIVFDSAKEARRWQALKLLERARCVSDIERQVRFPLHVNGVLIATYVCDFRYVDLQADSAVIVEDVKGVITREYKIKRALMQALHGVEILET